MPQHFADTLDRYAFGECHGRGERVAGLVEIEKRYKQWKREENKTESAGN